MSAPEYPPLSLQLEHISTEHLLRVDLPRSAYSSIAELVTKYPSVTREQFVELCEHISGSADPNISLTDSQKLAAFEQLQADGKLTLAEVADGEGIFGVIGYKEPALPLTEKAAKKAFAGESRLAGKKYRETHGGKAPPIELSIGRALIGNHQAERAERLLRVARHAIIGTRHRREAQTHSTNTSRRIDIAGVDPIVQTWAKNRQTLAVLQPPAIDLLRPEQIDVSTIEGGELFGRENLADSTIEIYERYMARLKDGDYTPKDAIALKSEITKAYTQRQLEAYYPNGIPAVLLARLTDITLQFQASREGNAILREYQTAARDIANAQKKTGSNEDTVER